MKVVHSKTFLRSGTVVGSFKIDLKTVYDTTGIYFGFIILLKRTSDAVSQYIS